MLTDVYIAHQFAASPLSVPIHESAEADGVVGALPNVDFHVTPHTSMSEVMAEFRRRPHLPGVMILEKSQLVGMLSQAKCLEALSRPYGNELFLHRPVLNLARKVGFSPLVLHERVSVEGAVQYALSRPAQQRYEPVIVTFSGNRYRLVDLYVLLMAQSQLLDKARDTAQQANRVKSEFLSHMSHELRTPLNAVLNFSAFVADGLLGEVNSEQVDALQKVNDSASHLLSLISDVLDISKIEAGMMSLFIEEVDLNTAVQATISIAKGLLKTKTLELILEVEPDLPRMIGDKRRVRQIMINLASNAIKYTREGHVKIIARQYHEQAAFYFAVEDSGIGIAPQDHQAVFENFRQVHHHTVDNVAGTGLGLPICKHFVEAHGGSIWFESQLGQGSTFHVLLPLNGVSG